MFATLLIANRGEIACRIARTAKRLGLRVIAVYSDADEDAPHVRVADEALRLGPAPANESYLKAGRILALAKEHGADAIHPGYGFLSENADFAAMCAEAGIAFVGPPPDAIRAMGLKDRAKALMRDAGVPVVPGYDGDNQNADFLRRKAYEIGYPVLVKAVAGGGGKGMRLVAKAKDFDGALEGAKREAAASFGNDRVLLEKFVAAPRHIEVQVFADGQGNVVHLFERDCSLQRRHQKVIEEAPAPGMSPEVRSAMGEAACAAARAVGYEGAGTVEFIVDGSNGLQVDGFFFMEMNTRLQVEHPVTEAITGLDLVEWQLRVASGETLPKRQDELTITGHAVEARVYAEDPANGFMPSPGMVHLAEFPEGVGIRVDAGVEKGFAIPQHYDPMIAKVIAHAESRDAALDRLSDALGDTHVAGPRTNIAFLRACLADASFRSAEFDTGLIDRKLDTLAPQIVVEEADFAAAAAAFDEQRRARDAAHAQRAGGDPRSPWSVADDFRIGPKPSRTTAIETDGQRSDVQVGSPAKDRRVVLVEDAAYVLHAGRQVVMRTPREGAGAANEDGDGNVRTPMSGRVVQILVEEGSAVEQGAPLFVVEAMKMEHVVKSAVVGTVSAVEAATGDQVSDGAVVVRIEAG